jgi:hypothetical protein
MSRQPDRNPSVEQLDEVREALSGFLQTQRVIEPTIWQQEDAFLPWFTRLADAWRPIRPSIAGVKGWPHEVGRALLHIAKHFDAIAATWGWERLTEPEPGRSAWMRERKKRFEAEVDAPWYGAAIAEQDGSKLHCRVDAIANEGRRLGYVATGDPQDAPARFDEADKRRAMTPRYGKTRPRISEEEWSDLVHALNLILVVLSKDASQRRLDDDRQRGSKASKRKGKTDDPANLDDLTPTAWKLLKTLSKLRATSTEKAVTRERIVEEAADVGNADSGHVRAAFKKLVDKELIASRPNVGTWIRQAGLDALKRHQ